jgi:hypothetical protein
MSAYFQRQLRHPPGRPFVPMSSREAGPTAAPANLFRLLSEFILLLLGALLILLALTRRVGLPARPAALLFLGVLFVYWGIRAWMRREPDSTRAQTHLRAGSLVLVGLLVLGIPLLPLTDASLLLGIAGAVLVLRGIANALLSFMKN